jgi:hypothetical protein
MTKPAPLVTPNLPGDLSFDGYNFKVNTNHGALLYKQPAPRARLRTTGRRSPNQRPDFVGRVQELVQLEKHIADHESVLVLAPEGFGKTALLLQAASGSAARALPHGVVFVEPLAANQKPLDLNDLTQQIFDTLYESEPPLKITAATARTYLANTQPLIIVDNCQLPGRTELDALLDLVPHGVFLISSPGALSADLPQFKLGPLARTDSLRLLAPKLNLELDESNRADLDSLCALLGDQPLAIVTAANTIRERSIPLSIAHLSLVKLRSSTPNSTPLRLAYEFTRLNLSAAERSLLAVAANTPGLSVDADWLRTATNNPANFDTTLYNLQSMELLHAFSPRYRVAPGLRALAQLAQPDRDDLLQRLSQYLLERLLINDSDFAYCAAELGNILAVIDWAIGRRLWTLALDLCRAIDPFLALRGQWESWKIVLTQALAAARGKGDRAAEAWALHQLGTQAIGVDTQAVARGLLEQALDLRQALGDEIGAAYTRHNLDIVYPGAPTPLRDSAPTPKPSAGRTLIIIGLLVFSVGLVVLATLFIGGFLILNSLHLRVP